MADASQPTDSLYGTWRLVGSRAVDRHGTPVRAPWGPNPMGCLILNPTGRMAAVLCDARVELPSGEKRAYSSYCGQFVVKGDTLTTTIDVASDEMRIGTKQPRKFFFQGAQLVLRPPAHADGEQREIYWERVSA